MRSLLLSHAFKCTAGSFCTQLPRCDLLCVYASSFSSLFLHPQPQSILCHPSWNACKRNIPLSYTWGHQSCSDTAELHHISPIISGWYRGARGCPCPCTCQPTYSCLAPPSGVAGQWVLGCWSLTALPLHPFHHLGKVLMQHGRGQTARQTVAARPGTPELPALFAWFGSKPGAVVQTLCGRCGCKLRAAVSKWVMWHWCALAEQGLCFGSREG